MNEPILETTAARRYAEAYESHYTTKDLTAAVQAYERIVTRHPDTPEAGYARSQIQNLVQQVVPARVLLDAQVGLVLRCIRPGGAPPLRVGA